MCIDGYLRSMVQRLAIVLLLVIALGILKCQDLRYDSIALLYADATQGQIDQLYLLADSLLTDDPSSAKEYVQLYGDKVASTGSEFQALRSSFLNVLYARKTKQSNTIELANAALEKLTNRNLRNGHQEELEHQYIQMNLALMHALQEKGERDQSVQMGLELSQHLSTAVVDQVHDYRFKTFYALSHLFLFDNDEISTRYADSALVSALSTDNEEWQYQAQSLKYYTRYYHNDARELDSIADRCIVIAERVGGPTLLGEAYMHKCNALVEMNLLSRAMVYCDLADAEYSKIADSTYLASTLHNMGNVFKKAGDQRKALRYYERAFQYRSVERPDGYYNTAEAIADEFYSIGEYKKSADMYHQFTDGFYQYYQGQLQSNFAEAEEKFQSALKDEQLKVQEIEIDKKDRQRRLYLLGGLLIIALLLSLFYAFYQRAQRKERESALALEMERQLAQNLQDMADSKMTFFNNVSHEIRTPLTLILAPLQEALGTVKNVDVRRQLLLAQKNSKRLQTLTDEIMALSKLDSGKMTMESTDISLKSFLSRIFYSFESLAITQDINLQIFEDVGDHVGIRSDALKLEKIINNLLSNALKYTHKGGHVSLSLAEARLDEGHLEVTVSDNGPGIPADELDMIFDRYYQSSITPSSSGTGIGLSFAKELADFLSGTLTVASIQSKGSSFLLSIPVEIIHIERPAVSKETEEVASQVLPAIYLSGQKPQVLIVEDNLDMSTYLSGLLSEHCKTITAANGQEAIEVLSSHKIDLISSDIMMPQMDGFLFKKEVNDHAEWSNIPFIILSARALDADKLQGLHLGIDDYITKPFNADEYRARVFNLLKNKVARDTAIEEPSYQDNLVDTITKEIETYLDDPSYKVTSLAKEVSLSPRQLNRVLKKQTGLSPVEMILELRLLRAYDIIATRQYSTINEVRYDVGIESASYFSSKFKDRFGIQPSELH